MSDLERALAVAVRHIDAPSTTEKERESILVAAEIHFRGEAGEAASRSLFHLREQRRQQLLLRGLIDREPPKPENGK